MARFKFFVGRDGHKAMECIAEVPSADDLPTFEGGKVVVHTPMGDVMVELPSAHDLLVKQMTIELQHGSRDTCFPPEEGEKKASKKRVTGFVE